MIKVAIVILNWNGKKYLEKFLPSVITHSDVDGCKIFIADNGSTDGSIEFLTKNYPEISQIKFDINYGFALGYVKALENIKAEYFVLLNSDVEVTPQWLEPLIYMMDNDKSIAACMPKMKSFDNKEYFEYSGAAGGFIDKYGYPFCRGRILDVIEKDNGQYDDECEIFWATGACMFIRASAYFEAGELDGDFFAHMEEIDLCWRMKKRGYKIMYNPNVSVFHVGGGTLPNNNPRKLFLNYRNNLYLLFKNLPSERFLNTFITRICFDWTSSVIYLISLKPRFSFSVVKAHYAFLCNLSSVIKKRRALQSISKNKADKQIYPYSILKYYFIKKKRHFSQLNHQNIVC